MSESTGEDTPQDVLPTDLNALYQQGVQQLVDAAPMEAWQALWLFVEVQPDGSGGTMAAFAIPEDAPDTARYFGLEFGHFHTWRRVWQGFMDEGKDLWSSVTVAVKADGKFSINYSYEPLGDELPSQRRQRWLQTYLPEVEVQYD